MRRKTLLPPLGFLLFAGGSVPLASQPFRKAEERSPEERKIPEPPRSAFASFHGRTAPGPRPPSSPLHLSSSSSASRPEAAPPRQRQDQEAPRGKSAEETLEQFRNLVGSADRELELLQNLDFPCLERGDDPGGKETLKGLGLVLGTISETCRQTHETLQEFEPNPGRSGRGEARTLGPEEAGEEGRNPPGPSLLVHPGLVFTMPHRIRSTRESLADLGSRAPRALASPRAAARPKKVRSILQEFNGAMALALERLGAIREDGERLAKAFSPDITPAACGAGFPAARRGRP